MQVDFVRRIIDDRLAALRTSQGEASQRPGGAMREPTKVGEFAGIPIMADPSVKPGTIEARAGIDFARPGSERTVETRWMPISDANVLERAAMAMRERGIERTTPTGLECMAHDLRAASAPVPAPKPVDVFEAFATGYFNGVPSPFLAERARAVFGPLVAALEDAAEGGCEDPPSLDNWTCSGCWPCEAKKIVAALRQRAQEASRE